MTEPPVRKVLTPPTVLKKTKKVVAAIVPENNNPLSSNVDICEEMKKYEKMIAVAQDQFMDIVGHFVNLPLPFIATIKDYYSDTASVLQFEADKNKIQEEIQRINNKIYEGTHPEVTKKKSTKKVVSTDVS